MRPVPEVMMRALYVERLSAIHGLHPVAKILGLFCVFIAAFVTDNPVVLLPLLAATLAVGAAGPGISKGPLTDVGGLLL